MTSSAFMTWLETALRLAQPEPVPAFAQSLRHVVGQATGYSAVQIAPFVRSLRSCFDGSVTLVVDDDPDLNAFLAEHDVRAVRPSSPEGWAPNVVVSRIAEFDSILSQTAQDGSALLTDVRDVVFQADPLSPPPTRIEAFDEQDGQVFGDHSLNRKYARALVGRPLARVLDPHPALCVGTIVGPVVELRRLCRLILMLCAIPRSDLGGAFGADQAAFNLAIHLGLVDAKVQPNFLRVATVGVPDAERTTVTNGRITNPDGTVSPIVHQYDRHAHLIRHVNARWNVSTGLRPRRHDRKLRSQARKLSESVRKRLPEMR